MGDTTTLSPKVKLYDLKEVCAMTKLVPSVVYAKMAAGEFPKPFKIGRKNVWRESTLIAFFDRRDLKAGNRI